MSPQCAILANAGTPLVWAGCFTLWIGNAIIGWGEAAMIHRLLRTDIRWRTIRIMIAANYVSMIAGMAIILAVPGIEVFIDRYVTINNVVWYHLAAFLVFLAITILIEWPFVAACLPNERRLRQSLRVNVIVQSTSYAVLAILAIPFSCSPFGIIRGFRVVDIHDMDLVSDKCWIYYISADDHELWRVRANGEHRERCLKIRFIRC